MKNIQLDENVLMELLELPTWLSITNARCNKASLKVNDFFNHANVSLFNYNFLYRFNGPN